MYRRERNKVLWARYKTLISLLVLVTSIAAFSSGCGMIKIQIPTIDAKIGVEKTPPVEAGLLISESTKAYVFRGSPESQFGSARTYEFRLGDALEKASFDVFSQIFEKVHLVRTDQDASKFPLVIKPQIEDFHFRFNFWDAFSITAASKIRVRVTLASGETKIWEKSLESPEHQKGPKGDVEDNIGKAASEALGYVLKKIAVDIASDESIWQFVKNK